MFENYFKFSGVIKSITPLGTDEEHQTEKRIRKEKNQKPPKRYFRMDIMGLGSTIPFYISEDLIIDLQPHKQVIVEGELSPKQNTQGKPDVKKITVIK